MAFSCKIKCASFCNYDKARFCPFYKEIENFPTPIQDKSVDSFKKIAPKAKNKTPKLRKKSENGLVGMTFLCEFPLPFLFKKASEDENGNIIYVDYDIPITAYGQVDPEDTCVAYIYQVVTANAFEETYIDDNETIIEVQKVEGKGNLELTFNTLSDFSGTMNLDFEINGSKRISASGIFETEYQSLAVSGYEKWYSGTITFEKESVKKTENIKFYTDM